MKKSTFWSCSWKINTIWRHFQLPWCRFAPITAHWLSINICQLLLWEIDNVVKECWFIFDQHHLVFWQFDLSLLSKRERERKGRFLIRLLLVSVDAEMQSVRTIALSVCVIFATQQMSGGLWVQATWREVKRFSFAYAIHIVMIQRFSCNYWTVKWNPPQKKQPKTQGLLKHVHIYVVLELVFDAIKSETNLEVAVALWAGVWSDSSTRGEPL